VVVARCARKCAVCFFEVLGEFGALVVDVVIAGFARAHDVAAVAPGITAGW
jgi:hypothetical protein